MNRQRCLMICRSRRAWRPEAAAPNGKLTRRSEPIANPAHASGAPLPSPRSGLAVQLSLDATLLARREAVVLVNLRAVGRGKELRVLFDGISRDHPEPLLGNVHR